MDPLKPAPAKDPYVPWMCLLLIAGILCRVWRYALHFPLRGDEAMLALNLLDFHEFGPAFGQAMHYNQVAPPLFFIISQAMRLGFGCDEWVLRLLPMAAGLAALMGFFWFLRRNVGSLAAAIATALMAVSFNPVMDAADFKPYAVDLFCGVVYLAIGWRLLGIQKNAISGEPLPCPPGGLPRRTLWALLLIGPLSIALSFPAALLFGGLSLMLLPVLFRRGRIADWSIYIGCNLLSAAAFFWAIAPTFSPAYQSVNQTMQQFWQSGFPGHGFSGVVQWLWQANVKAVFGYPFRDRQWLGALCGAFALVGIAALLRQKQQRLLGLLLLPFALTVFAAIVRKYPYGGDTRLAQHLAPAVFLLVGVGIGALVEALRKGGRAWAPWIAHGLLAALFLIVPVRMIHDFRHPYLRPADNSPALDAAARAAAIKIATELRDSPPVHFYAVDAEADAPSVFNWYLQNHLANIQWQAPPPAQLISQGDAGGFVELLYPAENDPPVALQPGWTRTTLLDEPFFLEKGGKRQVRVDRFAPPASK